MKSYRVEFLMALGEAMEDASRVYSNDPHYPETKGEKEQVKRCFEMMAAACQAFELPIVGKSYAELADDLPTESSLFWFAYNQFNELMKDKTLFYASDDAKSLFNQKAPFGKEVEAAFPSAGPDLTDAGSCLAVGQPNAAVFHLLRAMEVPMTLFAAEFGVTKFNNWNSALNELEEAVRDRANATRRPNWADEKDYFTDMIPFLYTVKKCLAKLHYASQDAAF